MTQTYILSVPHTGTNWLQDFLGPHCYGRAHTHVEATPSGPSLVPFVTVPLRDPSAVWRSWAKRSAPSSLPPREAKFFFAWAHLAKLVNEDTLFVPLDRPERAEQIKELNARLCADLVPNWDRYIGRMDWPDVEPPKVDLSPIYALPFVRRFYVQDQATV